MAEVYQNVGHIVLMIILLVCSAFFSGSETAFFNLTPRQVSLLRKSTHRFQHLTARVLNSPQNLLSCLLFGNMTVNILFFAVSSTLVVKIEDRLGVTAAAGAAFVTFAMVLLFGEILPKSLAYNNSKRLSVAVSLPAFLVVRIFTPIVFLFRLLIVEPVIRLILGPVTPAKGITTDEFQTLIDASRQSGLITADENKLLTEIIELGFLKVRDCLRPRVDMEVCSVTDSPEKACEIMRENQLTRLPVYAGRLDNIIGLTFLRDILLTGDDSLDKLVRKVNFVPEQKTVESLLEFFRSTGTDIAIVVDEYGGIAGVIELEDIAEELFGPFEIEGEIEPIEQTGPFEYRLAGDLAIHDWARAFNIDAAKTRICTIGGMVTALLGKIPQKGDVTSLKNLTFTVEKVRKRRIETVILTLKPISDNDK